jgi:hypothetical protein
MANKPFDTTIIRPLERPLSSDLDAAQSQIYRTIREVASRTYSRTNFVSSVGRYGYSRSFGFIGQGLRLYQEASPATMNLTIRSGLGFRSGTTASDIDGVVGLNDLSDYTPVMLTDNVTVTVPAAPAAGFARRDLLQVRINRAVTDTTSRWLLNPTSQTFAPTNIGKTLTFDLGSAVTIVNPGDPVGVNPIEYVVGTNAPYAIPDDFLSISSPATSADYISIAVVNVAGGAVAIGNDHIVDLRGLIFPSGEARLAMTAQLGNNGGWYNIDSADFSPGFINVGLRALASTTDNTYLLYLFGVGAFTARLWGSSYLTANGQYARQISQTGPAVFGVTNTAVLTGTVQFGPSGSATSPAIGQDYIAIPFVFGSVVSPGAGLISTVSFINNLDALGATANLFVDLAD